MERVLSSPYVEWLRGPGRLGVQVLGELGRLTLFLLGGLARIPLPPYRPGRVLGHIHFIGAKSLFVVGLTGLFTGMVLGLQGYYVLVKFGYETKLGSGVALSLIRELGPVLTALMVTGRAGSSIAAEIGIMRISEQIDALDTMDIDPMHYLVAPRLLAGLLCFPLLTAFFDVVGILGGYMTGVWMLGINAGTFLTHMEKDVLMSDITGGLLKSLVFALIVITVCCYQGYSVHRRAKGFGARGVSFSTTTAVVMSSVLVLIFDYVLTSFLL